MNYPIHKFNIFLLLLLYLAVGCGDAINLKQQQKIKVVPSWYDKNNINMAFENFTVENGLTDNDITDFIEDDNGIYWFATGKGLTRYDGIEFKSYTEIDVNGKKRGIASVDGLCLDDKGTIWMIESNRGILSINTITEQLTSFENTTIAKWDVAFPRRLFYTNSKVYYNYPFGYFDTNLNIYKNLDTLSGYSVLKGDIIFSFANNPKSKLHDYFRTYNTKTAEFIITDSIPKHLLMGCNDIIGGQDDILYLGFQTGELKEFNLKTRSIKVYERQPDLPPHFRRGCTIRRVEYDSLSKCVFMAGFCKFMRFDTDNNALYPFLKNLPSPFDKNAIKDSQIRFIKRDRFGNIWVGSHDMGLFLYNTSKDVFEQIRSKPGDSLALLQNQVNALCFDRDERLYIGTQSSGLYKQLDNFTLGVMNYKQKREFGVISGNINRIHNILLDTFTSSVFTTNWGFYPYKHDLIHQKYDVILPANLTIEQMKRLHGNLFVLDCKIIKDKYLVLALWGGTLFIYNIESNKLFFVCNEADLGESYKKNNITGLTRTLDYYDNSFYFGFDRTERGIYKVDYKVEDLFQNTQGDTCISSMPFEYQLIELKDSLGSIYRYTDLNKIRTYDGKHLFIATTTGFFKHNLEKNITKKYGIAEGLMTENIMSFEKSGNSIWVSTDNGLYEIDILTDKVITTWTVAEGLPSNSFRLLASAVSITGKLAFATNEGIIALHPSKLKKEASKPLKVVSVEVNGKLKQLSSKLYLSHYENNLRLSFGYENPAITKKGRYKYRLNGFDKEWHTTSTIPIATYTNVYPGKYTFEVKQIGINHNNILQIPIIIHEVWYKLWWIQFLILVSLFSIAKYIWNKRQERIKVQDEEKNKLIKYLQIQTLQSQINPHFIFNVLSSMQNKVMTDSPETANKHIVNLSKLIRRFLDSTVNSVAKDNKISTSEISLAEEIELLEMYIQFEQMQRPEKFDYQIHISPGIQPDNTYLPPMLIQPYVENSIKHGLFYKEGRGILKLQFEVDGETLHIDVIDNGVGRSKAGDIQKESRKIYISRGKSLVEERVNLLNEVGYNIDIKTVDNPDGGTSVSIKIN